MKQFIKNLLMPFAVVAMLSVGAFTVNASNKDKTLKVETIELTQEVYQGKLYFKVGENYHPTILSNPGNCTETQTSKPFYADIDESTERERMYGWNDLEGEYQPLFEITVNNN